MGVALFRYRSIRALCRPISLSLNTGSVSPYLARWAQYGLCVALSRPLGSIRALVIPGLRYAHPGLYSGAPSGRSLHPRQIDNTRTAGVISPSQNQQHPHRGRHFPIAKSTTPAPRASFSHRQINHARTAGVSPHRQISHICHRQMSIPHRHLWRGGGR